MFSLRCAKLSLWGPGLLPTRTMGRTWQNTWSVKRFSPLPNTRSQMRSFSDNSASKPLSQLTETFIDGTSANYVEQMYRAWKKDPASVHTSWAAYFGNVERGAPAGKGFALPPGLATPTSSVVPVQVASDVQGNLRDFLAVHDLIRAFQRDGHLQANLDPLKFSPIPKVPHLDPKYYGFFDADMEREFAIDPTVLQGAPPILKLKDLVSRLQSTYNQTIGIQYTHITDPQQREWIQKRFETPKKYEFSKEDKINILDRLMWADHFEKLLGTKYNTDKRFGLDGCEILIPAMKTLIDRAAELGVQNVVIGMPHRGRLNVLANVVRKPVEAILKEFAKLPKDDQPPDWSIHSGDVKYHLGTSFDRPTRSGKRIHLSLLSNPSHLEAVDPLVEGKTNAKQFYANDSAKKTAVALQLHGDAAFAGQGVVYETLGMNGLQNYSTGGTIHIIVNNQIGFTTDPKDGRSTTYCSDIGKMFDIPIFHVNGDDAEAVVWVHQMASEYRQQFGKSVIVDIVCYRRFGHNEVDNPFLTQPTLYSKISKHPSVLDIYQEQLKKEGVLSQERINEMKKKTDDYLENAFTQAPKWKDNHSDWLESKWEGFKSARQAARNTSTGVSLDTLKKVGEGFCHYPEHMKLHRILERNMKEKLAMIETGEGVDWATGEALAFGTLLLEGNHIRLSGQDVERGTFSHRHAVIHDQETNETYTPLNHIASNQAKFVISNSPLHEYGVLGFELGYSLESPNALILWEAQFGDFSNGAQIIIDQFLSCGEQKWNRQSGLTLLLPHGYDGMGPEHSSARLERFLQLEDAAPNEIPVFNQDQVTQHQRANMQVVNCTTPANYFHVLRRQLHRDFRKPLVVMSPKSLLRDKRATSLLADFGPDTKFQRVIGETKSNQLVSSDKIRKLIFCSGQVYYAITTEREAKGIKDIAVVRLEQLAPFPFDLIQEQLKLYPKANLVWVQEEPENMGPWHFVQPHFQTATNAVGYLKPNMSYVGRRASASPAAGTYIQHSSELHNLLHHAME